MRYGLNELWRSGWVLAIQLYQGGISPLLGPGCRYTPSCSSFAIEAIERHGVARGIGMTAARLSRCHPWGGSGCDPVP